VSDILFLPTQILELWNGWNSLAAKWMGREYLRVGGWSIEFIFGL
jgi:hypothetical protein